jgi:hypothetical protein
MINKNIYNSLLILFAIIGSASAIVIYQYQFIIANGLLGVSTIYLIFFRNAYNAQGTLEEILLRKNKIKPLLYVSFMAFVLTLSFRTIIRVFSFLFQIF